MPLDYPYNDWPEPRPVIPRYLPPDAIVDELGAAQLPYVPGRLPVFTEAAWSDPSPSPAQRIGLAFGDRPIPYHPTGQAGDFFAALLSSAANSYGTSALRADQERQGRNAFVAGTNRQANDLNSRMDRLAFTQDQLRQRANFAAQKKAELEAQKDKANAERDAARGAQSMELLKTRLNAPRPVAAGGGSTPLSSLALDDAAILYGKTGFIQPRTAESTRNQIQNRWVEIKNERGLGSDLATNKIDYKAQGKSLGTQQSMADMYESYQRTVVSNSQVLKGMMAKIKDTGSPVFNKPVRDLARSAQGSPEQAAYKAAAQVVIPEFARLLQSSPNLTGQLTLQGQHEVASILDESYTIPQMIKVLDEVLIPDAETRVRNAKLQADEIKNRVRQPGFGVDSLSSKAPVRMIDPNDPNKTVRLVPADKVAAMKKAGAIEVGK